MQQRSGSCGIEFWTIHALDQSHIIKTSTWTSLEKTYLICTLNFWFGPLPHLFTWKRLGLWPKMQPATRGWSRDFGFTFGSCHVIHLYTQSMVSLNRPHLVGYIHRAFMYVINYMKMSICMDLVTFNPQKRPHSCSELVSVTVTIWLQHSTNYSLQIWEWEENCLDTPWGRVQEEEWRMADEFFKGGGGGKWTAGPGAEYHGEMDNTVFAWEIQAFFTTQLVHQPNPTGPDMSRNHRRTFARAKQGTEEREKGWKEHE